MAFNYDFYSLKERCLEILNSNEDVYFVSDLITELDCSKQTYYIKGLNKDEEIEDALHRNKVKKKRMLRKNWESLPNASVQLALYKLLANSDELDRLNSNQKMIVENTGISRESIEDIAPTLLALANKVNGAK